MKPPPPPPPSSASKAKALASALFKEAKKKKPFIKTPLAYVMAVVAGAIVAPTGLIIFWIIPLPASAHSGGTDASGCHNSATGYHCHGGGSYQPSSPSSYGGSSYTPSYQPSSPGRNYGVRRNFGIKGRSNGGNGSGTYTSQELTGCRWPSEDEIKKAARGGRVEISGGDCIFIINPKSQDRYRW
jgi:hypothetical protein